MFVGGKLHVTLLSVCLLCILELGGRLPVSRGDPKLPRPGGLSLQARILLLNCSA